MIPVIVVCVYLVIIGVIGSLAFRQSKANTEDFFLANRGVGSMVFFLIAWIAVVVWMLGKRPEELDAHARLPLEGENVEVDHGTVRRQGPPRR